MYEQKLMRHNTLSLNKPYDELSSLKTFVLLCDGSSALIFKTLNTANRLLQSLHVRFASTTEEVKGPLIFSGKVSANVLDPFGLPHCPYLLKLVGVTIYKMARNICSPPTTNAQFVCHSALLILADFRGL